MRLSKAWLVGAVGIAALSAHLLAEVARRFFVAGDLPFLLADVVLAGGAIAVAGASRLRLPRHAAIGSMAFFILGGASLLASGRNPVLLLPGVRPLALGWFAFLAAQAVVRARSDGLQTLGRVLLAWTLFALIVAGLQLWAGPDSWLNLQDGETMGVGDYVGAGGGLDWLFRPTSFFGHTGRLGQFAFIGALVFWVQIGVGGRTGPRLVFAALVSLALVLVSGQRAAGVFAFMGFCAALVLALRSPRKVVKAGLAMALVAVAVVSLPGDLGEVVLGRFSVGMTDGFDRVADNATLLDETLADHALLGEGLGYHSFGGESMGGVMFLHVGGGENDWLRIVAEVGFLGAAAFLFISLALIARNLRAALRTTDSMHTGVHMAASMALVSSILWGGTHYVYANYLHMIAIFSIAGAAEAVLPSAYGEPEPEGTPT